jgi:hypothetical protein
MGCSGNLSMCMALRRQLAPIGQAKWICARGYEAAHLLMPDLGLS